MGNRNFRQFPSPLELGRTTTTSPTVRRGLLAPFTDVDDVEDVDIDIDGDGVARPRPPRVDEAEERARRRSDPIRSGTPQRRAAFAGQGRRPIGLL